jgi:hypothetical protein
MEPASPYFLEPAMTPQPGSIVRLPLSPDQQAVIKGLIARTGETLELTVEELEERITPRVAYNHNEPLLTGRCRGWRARFDRGLLQSRLQHALREQTGLSIAVQVLERDRVPRTEGKASG